MAFTNDSANVLTQFYTIMIVGAFVCATTALAWMGLKLTVGLRVDEETEITGLDMAELGMEAYPEFNPV